MLNQIEKKKRVFFDFYLKRLHFFLEKKSPKKLKKHVFKN